MSLRRTLGVYAFVAVNLLTACPRDPYEPDAGRGDGGTGPYSADGGASSTKTCAKSAEVVQVRNIDKLDLLLMVDNSNSMADEQRSLKEQFPGLIRVLTTGNRFDGDPNPFPPAKDLHVGVVSSDMGVPGVELPPSCHADGGDDGRLQNTSRGEGCDAQYPTWLSFLGDAKLGTLTDPVKFANDIGCIATLGTGGCGFEQQLEAPLKALMPKLLTDAAGNVISNPYRFIATEESRSWGRGDMPVSQGGNAGFLRSSAAEGVSLVAIVVITDEEDCSVRSTDHLKPNSQLPESSPYRLEDINLRCFNHKEFLYDLQDRYLRGFRALRPGNEDLVMFAAIAGVPVDLVDNTALSQVNHDDDASREQFYSRILSDPRMIEEVDPTTMPSSGQGNLRPSCVRPPPPGELAPSTAFPPRRLVELARLFGKNGIVQSICQDDFGPAISTVVNVLAKRLGEKCLPHKLTRQTSGVVGCNVIWELPAQALPGAPTPTACSQLPFLGPVDQGSQTMNAAGGVNCKVSQLPVTNAASKVAPPGEGWFYDDYTDDVAKICTSDQPQRIAFSAGAKPPHGVTVKLECSNPFPTVARSQSTNAGPQIGISCAVATGGPVDGDLACLFPGPTGELDTSVFCHPGLNLCAKQCTANTDCPNGWRCDSSAEALSATSGRAFCVDPKCKP